MPSLSELIRLPAWASSKSLTHMGHTSAHHTIGAFKTPRILHMNSLKLIVCPKHGFLPLQILQKEKS